MSELGGTINERIGDLRTSMNLSQTELSEKQVFLYQLSVESKAERLPLSGMMYWQS